MQRYVNSFNIVNRQQGVLKQTRTGVVHIPPIHIRIRIVEITMKKKQSAESMTGAEHLSCSHSSTRDYKHSFSYPDAYGGCTHSPHQHTCNT